MKKTYVTRLVLSDDSKNQLIQMLQAATYCWNECSKVKYNIAKNSIVDLHAAFYSKFRESNKHIPSQLVIISENSVLSTYRTIKSNKHKITQPPEKKRLSVRLDKRTYSYANGIFSIISLKKRIKCSIYKYPKLNECFQYKFCDPLLFERDGDIWMALTFEFPEIIPPNNLAIGVDLGIRIPAATSEGKLIISKSFNKRKRNLRYLKSKLKSKGTRSAKKHLKKINNKEHNINKNFVHSLTNEILKTKADTIVLENLKSIKVKKNKFKNFNKLSQVLFGKIREVLTYKAPSLGKMVIQVCPSFTSQIDSLTGKKDGIRRGRRYYSKSGQIYDADCNASNNIALKANLPVSLFCGTYGQATVTRLNV